MRRGGEQGRSRRGASAKRRRCSLGSHCLAGLPGMCPQPGCLLLSSLATSSELSPKKALSGDFSHFVDKEESVRLFALRNEPELLEVLK